VKALAAGMLTGADSIVDMDLLRQGGSAVQGADAVDAGGCFCGRSPVERKRSFLDTGSLPGVARLGDRAVARVRVCAVRLGPVGGLLSRRLLSVIPYDDVGVGRRRSG
jgi:hypothetical protein